MTCIFLVLLPSTTIYVCRIPILDSKKRNEVQAFFSQSELTGAVNLPVLLAKAGLAEDNNGMNFGLSNFLLEKFRMLS